jgi:hypothetical protein
MKNSSHQLQLKTARYQDSKMPKAKKHELRESVLKGFIHQLIWYSITEQEREEIHASTTKERKRIDLSMALNPNRGELILTQDIPLAPSPYNIKSSEPMLAKPRNNKNLQIQIPKRNPKQITAGKESINLGKIASILKDPSVMSLECPGTGKNILVNRSGVIQTSPLTLNKEEINTLMQKFSEKTRIPIVTGLYKAVFSDLLITAVISDYVGTRFIIHKRTPYKQY